MTPRDRMLVTMRHGKADCVPVSPDISNMIPCKLQKRPFWISMYIIILLCGKRFLKRLSTLIVMVIMMSAVSVLLQKIIRRLKEFICIKKKSVSMKSSYIELKWVT